MRFIKRPQIDPNENTQRVSYDSENEILNIAGRLSLFKDGITSTRTLLKSSSALSTDYTLTLPPNPGLPGQVLITDGTGNLSFTTADYGGNRIFVSALNGDDLNDGFNKPVKSIKKAAQIAASFSEPVNDPGQSAYDSRSLLRDNAAFIKAEVIAYIDYMILNNQSPFTSGFTYNKVTCARDIGYMIESVVYDLIFSGNAQCVYAGSSYYSATATLVISNQKAQSIAAINYVKYVCDAVLSNTLVAPNGTYPLAPYNEVVVQTIDLTKTPSGPNKTKIASGFDIITGILDGGLVSRPTIVDPVYIPLTVTIVVAAGDYYEDNPIITPDRSTIVGDDLRSVIIRPLNAGKDMFRVRNGMYMTGFTFRDGLDENGVPVTGWDYSIAFDDTEDYTTGRGEYIGLSPSKPIISTSPYIQNCSIISFLGSNGVLIDGEKIKTPNTPRIPQEAENPYVSPAPQQGKSMVANAFTMISFGGTGWKIINEAYAQLVSCFQIFMLNGVYASSGGYVSITNSATNFGINALRASGYSAGTFGFDKGVIADVGFDISGFQTLTSIGHGRVPINHYILKIKNNSLVDITSDYKSVTATIKTFNAATAINPTTGIITIATHGFSNGSSVLYTNGGNANISGLNSGDIFYVYYINENEISLYNDNSLTNKVKLNVGTGTHTLTQNVEEFFVNEITNNHSTYQELTLDSGGYTFIPGRPISGIVGDNVSSAYVYSWNSVTKKLIVSISDVSNNGVISKVVFTETSLIAEDHTEPPVTNITIASVIAVTGYYTATYTIKSTLNNPIINTASLQGKILWLNKPSIVNSSGHTWEYAGSGTDYNALPDNGGQTIVAAQQVSELPGRVYTSGTNELGDFTVGNFITAYNRTGNIVFTNKVTVSELSALKLSLSDISITAISTDIGLGDNEPGGASNSRLITQLSVRSFLANRLGDFIDKHVSTSAIPASIVQLNGNGQINADLIPPIRGFNTHLINSYGGRLSLYEKMPVDEVLAGDVITETYYETLLTLYDVKSLNSGDIIYQASSGATGTVKLTTTSSALVKLVYVTGTFVSGSGNTLERNGIALSTYPDIVGVATTTSDSFYLALDNTSQFLRLRTTSNYRFTIGNIVRAAVNGAIGTIRDYRCGYIATFGTITPGTGYTPLSSTATYYNVPLTGGLAKYTSAAGATSSGTTITVTSTANLEIGMALTITAGTGQFDANTVVTDIASLTSFTVSLTPIVALSGGSTVIRGNATGARADITVSSGIVTSVNLYRGGIGYQVGDILSASAFDVGGTVTIPFTVTVATIDKRLYLDQEGSIKFISTALNSDYIQDNNPSDFTITLDTSYTQTFDSRSIDNSGNVDYVNHRITLSGHAFSNGDPVNYTSGSNLPIGNLLNADTFYVGVYDSNTIELYIDFDRATKRTFGSSSTGIHTLTRYTVDIHSNTIVEIGHGLATGDVVKLSDFSITPPTAIIDGATISIPSISYWFIGSVTVNSFTLHQYSVDALSSINGDINNELHFITVGSGTAKFTIQNAKIVSVVNTSSKTASNYSSLTTSTLDTSSIISGIMNTTRLGTGTASSSNYLRGDSVWHTAVESISPAPNTPIQFAGSYDLGNITLTGISGTITTTSVTTTIIGISSTTSLFVGMTLTKETGVGTFGGTTTIISIDSNSQITIQSATSNSIGSIVFTATVPINKYYGNSLIDITRVDSTLLGSGSYTNTGVASFDTTYLVIGTGPTTGQVTVRQGVIDAGTLGGHNAAYYLNPSNLQSPVPVNKGGTYLTAYSVGDIIYATGTDTLDKLTIGAANTVMTSSGSAPRWSTSTGTLGNVVFSNSPTIENSLIAGNSSFDLINTVATTVNIAGAATTLTFGYNSTDASTTNISTGVTAPATTKTINIGTGSGANSSTDIRIGATAGGSITTINGNLVVGTILTVDQSVFSTGITTGITSSVTSIDTWAIATYRSAKYVLQVTCTAGTNINTYQVSEIVVIHDGSAAIMNEYSVIKTGNDLATFSVDIVSFTTFRLRAVAANSGDTITVKVQKMILTV